MQANATPTPTPADSIAPAAPVAVPAPAPAAAADSTSTTAAPADSAAQLVVTHIPIERVDASICVEREAPSGPEGLATHHGRVGYVDGIDAIPRPLLPGYDDHIALLLTAVFLLLAVSISRHTVFLRTFAGALVSGRRRSNTFDDEHTIDETRTTAALLILCCICEGIMLYFAATLGGYVGNAFISIAIATGVAAALMVAQTAGYLLTGYAFAPQAGDTRQWLRGFFASQSLLGLALTLPTLATLFYPGAAAVAVAIGAGLYVVARLIFIGKGFRFFYTNIFSLVYFILYLCTLEIVPLIFMWRMSAGAGALL